MITKANSYPRQNRLRKKAQFLLCYEHGKRFHSAHFSIFVFHTEELAPLTGFAVSRKVGNAVKRNRIKRLLREFFRLRKELLPNALIVVVAKQNLRYQNFCLCEVEKELMPIMERMSSR